MRKRSALPIPLLRTFLLFDFACPFFRAIQNILRRHPSTATAAKCKNSTDEQSHHEDDHQRSGAGAHGRGLTRRIRPSWAVLATSLPSRAKTLPRAKPRAPEALGLSVEYSNQSSTRTLR